jgi:aspartyl protease family protein
VIQAAYVTLESVQIAQIRLEDVQAVVVPQGLETSLLGMSFLGRLQRFEASQNTLILRL